MTNGNDSNAGRTSGRGVGLRWFALLVLLGVLAVLITWGWGSWKCGRILYDQTRLSADNLARGIALFGSQPITARDWNAVQGYADTLVREKPIEYIAVVDVGGRSVVHTDRGMRGARFDQRRYGRDVVHAFAPVLSYTRQVATVRVGMRTGQR